MKKTRKLLSLVLLFLVAVTASAQRVMDNLDRGVVAVKVNNGVFVSWRIQAEEYYDVTYNARELVPGELPRRVFLPYRRGEDADGWQRAYRFHPPQDEFQLGRLQVGERKARGRLPFHGSCQPFSGSDWRQV